MSPKKFDVFISYSRRDFDEVNEMVTRIQKALPWINIWFDLTGIESGDEFQNKIISAIDNSSIVIFALSDNSITKSKWTKKEVTYANNKSKRIIPILLKGAKLDGWFLFEFGNIDCININIDLQWNKLIRNLSGWFPNQKGYTDNNTISYKTLKNNSAKEEITTTEMCQLGHKYYNEGNYIEAANLYRNAAVKGDATAQFSLGVCYYNGTGIEQNFTEATNWFRKAAYQGNADAQYWLGYCYEHRQGIELNYLEAEKWYSKAAKQGHDAAKEKMGLRLENATDPVKSAPEDLSPSEMYKLGEKYFYEKKFTETVKWCSMAAEQGNLDAQNLLGMLYYEGLFGEHKYTEAVKWLRMAAEQGDRDAQAKLAVCYLKGKGVEKDAAESRKWYNKSKRREQ